jgi:DnaK suppressor protein
VDTARARALLDQERRRLEQLGRAVSRDHDDAVATSSPEDPVDGAGRRVAEETSQALGERLRDRWGALERAEARLAAGTYGASVLSGRPIPDERLEAFPLAELTVDEAAGIGAWAEGMNRSRGWARPAIPSECSRTRQPKTMGWSRTRGAMTSRAHRPTSASERPPRPNAATAWGRWTDSTPRTAAPVDAPDRAPAASSVQTAWRRGW